MRFLGKYWVPLCISLFGTMVLVICLFAPAPEQLATDLADVAAVPDRQIATAKEPVFTKPAPAPDAKAAERGAQSLQGQEPKFLKNMNDRDRQEFLAQLDEVARIELDMSEMQETEVLDESSFGMVETE